MRYLAKKSFLCLSGRDFIKERGCCRSPLRQRDSEGVGPFTTARFEMMARWREREREECRARSALRLAINFTEIIVVVVIKRVARVASFHFGGTAARQASTPSTLSSKFGDFQELAEIFFLQNYTYVVQEG